MRLSFPLLRPAEAQHKVVQRLLALLAVVVPLLAGSQRADAQLAGAERQVVTLKSSLQFEGKIGAISEIGETSVDVPDAIGARPIVFIDDGLRRIFLNKDQIANTVPSDRIEENISIFQKDVYGGDLGMSAVGTILSVGPFNIHGRRLITLDGGRRAKTIAQGITEITPSYCRLQTVSDRNLDKMELDMRIATSSLPSDVLVPLLKTQIKDQSSPSERLRIVDFLTQAERYREAEAELNSIRIDFPGLKDELKRQADILRQAVARQALDEVRFRRDAGQAALADELLKPLLRMPGIAGAVLAEISEVQQTIQQQQQTVEHARLQVDQLTNAALEGDQLNEGQRQLVQQFATEMQTELNIYNQPRLASFLRMAEDTEQSIEQRLALAISGWVIGSSSAMDNLAIAGSLVEARRLVTQYLQTQRAEQREAILQQLETLEAGAPQYVAKIIENLLPPLAPTLGERYAVEPLELTVSIPPTGGQGPRQPVRYLAQLPPEYNPYRRYPCIVSLGAANRTPEQQVGWWCGGTSADSELPLRFGQAARHGYIVLSPDWTRPGQREYEFSAREHAIVLATLRDALRRFSIDSDKVFLSGHYMGGDAAWDIALAHPEHWAGVIPISAQASKYIKRYRQNARSHLPFYFVNGERDFAATYANRANWNEALRYKGYDAIVVQFHGRGAEHFYDEIHNLFEWMKRQNRVFAVDQFQCSTMRPWDNYFWWLEVQSLRPEKMVHPAAWDETDIGEDWEVIGEFKGDNRFHLPVAQDNATVWLSPELVNFDAEIQITGAGNRFSGFVQPSREVILEDARRRADRQHLFWGRIDRIDKRWAAAE